MDVTTRNQGQETAETPEAPHSRTLKKLAFRVTKVAIIALVCVALGRHVWKLLREWTAEGPGLEGLTLNPAWLTAAAIIYAAGQVCLGLYWERLLDRLDTGASRYRVLRAYLAGTLGKYVPGKAMVIVLRTGLLGKVAASRFWVAMAVVFETLSMMVVASIVASVLLFLTDAAHRWIWALGILAAFGSTIGLHPAIFGRAARVFAIPFKDTNGGHSPRQWFTVFWRCNVLLLGGWLLLGASFYAVMRSIGAECNWGADFAFLTGSIALATVLGFVVIVLPAGLGVRELVVIHLLTPQFGVQVVAATLLLRTVWTATEVALAGLAYGLRPLAKAITAGRAVPSVASTVEGTIGSKS